MNGCTKKKITEKRQNSWPLLRKRPWVLSILPELFKPFVTANKKDGTALGLSIVKLFVEAHGGTIEVEKNQGAVFHLTLPLAE